MTDTEMVSVPRDGRFDKAMGEAGLKAAVGAINEAAAPKLNEPATLLLIVTCGYAAMLKAAAPPQAALAQAPDDSSGTQDAEIYAEITRALAKFPTWPTDPLHALAVLGEEYGELTKAVLQATYEPHKNKPGDVRDEAVQTAAMAIRFVRSLGRYRYVRSQQHTQAAPQPPVQPNARNDTHPTRKGPFNPPRPPGHHPYG